MRVEAEWRLSATEVVMATRITASSRHGGLTHGLTENATARMGPAQAHQGGEVDTELTPNQETI